MKSSRGFTILNQCRCKRMKKGCRAYFDRTRNGMTSSPIFSFSLCFFFLFLFAFTVMSSLFSFPFSVFPSVSLLLGRSEMGNNTINSQGFIRHVIIMISFFTLVISLKKDKLTQCGSFICLVDHCHAIELRCEE